MSTSRLRPLALFVLCCCAAGHAQSENAKFFRGWNLNGPALTIDGHAWEKDDAKDFRVSGKRFENQKVSLKPPTDAARAQMIRSSVWGDKVDLEVSNVPAGSYQVFLYVWEDNHNERFKLLVNGETVVEAFESGAEGMWKKLGPWKTTSGDGKIVVAARAASHGAANLSGLEIWAGDGAIPDAPAPQFVAAPTAEQVDFFEKRIRPVLTEQCYECHSANAKKIKGGLVLDSRAGVQRGGDTGPAVTPGDPDASLLIEAVRHQNEDIAMPPKKRLPPEVVRDFEQWVRMGVPDPRASDTVAIVQAKEAIDWNKAREWWSFRPLAAPKLPEVKDAAWAANDVDRFILARLEAAGLRPAADAEKRALIRRATYDLTGLPPAPEEVDAFLGDNSPRAFETVVDRLLASPRYGERWGRHWLDVARYADTAGDNSDFPIPQMRKYRDWVIAAFNRDLPYDEFVREQLAGDLLGGSSEEERQQRLIATGYIANARRFGSRVEDYPQHLTIEDTIDNFGRAFLGLTINCARCHDHKFDPISTQDYYALYGIFNSTRYPWPGIELEQKQRDLVPLVPAEKLAEAESKKKARDKEQARLDSDVKKLKEALKKITEGTAKAETDSKTAENEKAKLETDIQRAEKTAAEYRAQPAEYEFAYAVAEAPKAADVAVQIKGDPAKPGNVVHRRFLTVLGGAELPPNAKGSGRAQLADWLLAKENPLPARVMANRLWHYHFGRGIVPTPSDFGKQGKPPTHPELLDFLAAKFRDSGWSIKALHRLIMLSHTYRLSSGRDAATIERDPNNELFSAFPRQRLDAESIRDTMLALGGNLDLSAPKPHPFPPEKDWKFTQHNPFKAVYDTNQRSVYLMTQRIQRHPYLALFDGADPSASTPARPTSTTPVQALYLLNDAFVHDQARRIAARIIAEASTPDLRLQRAAQLILSRPLATDEVEFGKSFLTTVTPKLRESGTPEKETELAAWQSYVRSLFRVNEFVYID